MMKKSVFFFLFFLIALCGNGCAFSSYRQVRDFDLDVEPVSSDGRIRVEVVRNASSSGQRLQSRSYFELNKDPYHVWAIEPGALVCNALNRALGKDGVTPTIRLICELDCFEADLVQQEFRISGICQLRNSPEKTRFVITSPLRTHSPENIVLAASDSVKKLAARLAEFGKNIK